MGEKKARLEASVRKAAEIEEYIRNYLYSLRALMRKSPNIETIFTSKGMAVIGKAEIWPCQDGAVVLIYQDPNEKIEVVTKEPLSKTVDDFFKYGQALAFYDPNGNMIPRRLAIELGSATKCFIRLAEPLLQQGDIKYLPRYQKLMIAGWEAQLPEADEEAISDFKSVYITRNIVGETASNNSYQENQSILLTSATRIIDEFTDLLNNAEKEEDLQQYITEYPQILYPDYMECHPKFELGEDFVTDYVFLVQGHEGPEYIFVEIEKPKKCIYTNAGHFTAAFTQAKNQILDWDNWVTHNHAYVARKLPSLYKPKYHLIMGRSAEITKQQQREKLRTEFSSTNRIFSTFDDVLDHFKQLKARIGNKA